MQNEEVHSGKFFPTATSASKNLFQNGEIPTGNQSFCCKQKELFFQLFRTLFLIQFFVSDYKGGFPSNLWKGRENPALPGLN